MPTLPISRAEPLKSRRIKRSGIRVGGGDVPIVNPDISRVGPLRSVPKEAFQSTLGIGARMSGALARIEHWEKEIEAINEGTSQVMLGRAREMLSHARWRAEREFPSQWGGNKVNIQINTGVQSSELLESEAHELVKLIKTPTNEDKALVAENS